MVDGQPNAQLVYDLVIDEDSEPKPFLSELSRQFLECCKKQAFHVVSYYETRQSPTVIVSRLPNRQWNKLICEIGVSTRNMDKEGQENLDGYKRVGY